MCSAARRKTRAKRAKSEMRSKKAVPAKNSEANFWRPRFTRPLRAGKRANANFACSEGFFCARRAAPFAGLVVFARPAVLAAAFVPGVPAFFCRCAAVLSPACGQPAASALGLACAAGACLPFARRVFCVRIFVLFRLSVRPFCAVCAGFLSYLSPFPA